MLHYLNLIRWPNVLMTVLTQLVIVYAFLIPSGIDMALENWQLALLILSTALLTASGNVINDIHDVVIDQVNKPEKVIVGKHITEDRAFTMYIILTIIAVVCGFLLANSIDQPYMAVVFILVAFLLYLYATTLKSMLLIGNILISLLVGLVVMITVVFELYPVITPQNRAVQKAFFLIMLEFSFFAFVVNILREWVKDCQDMDGDHAGGRKTLPLVVGRTRTARIAFVFCLGLVIALGWYVYTYLYKNTVAVYYFTFLIIGPLLYTATQLWVADKPSQFKRISLVLKLVLLSGILSISVFYML